MKKLLAIVLSVAMIACFAVVASAAEAEKITATVSTVEVTEDMVGQEVQLVVGLSQSAHGYGVVELQLGEYDTTALEFVKLTKAKDMDGMYAANGDRISFIAADHDINGAEFCYVTFKVLKAADASATVTILNAQTYNDATSPDSTSAEVTVVPGGIKLGVPAPETSVVETEVTEVETSVVETEVTGTETDVPSKAGDSKAPAAVVTPDTTKNTTSNPKSGDASAVAVAGVLCAAMAAAFVITKKSK